MYGVRGANGVIVITTKHGQIGAPQVRVHVEHSINQPTKFPDFLDAPDYRRYSTNWLHRMERYYLLIKRVLIVPVADMIPIFIRT